ncbi:3-oxoacyl-[acyl-carrier-protein] synthase III C-terminal domain-containing protein [Sphingomonas sp.]|jgi:3-oxoacyl-[acyl-carrier-protein] synthase-3|uniref:3-oxoacyl-[acyl-carrier-protein] synthase III C-terminal domain-containing protein n=1 Tax=Sphingomonas sp. TaxID=28214 RepID=UPI0035C84C40
MGSNPFSIAAIGTHVASERLDNVPRAERFAYDQDSLRTKIGVLATARKEAGQETSDLCVLAYQDLAAKCGDALSPETLDLIVVVTQHPDGFGLPHTAAIVHGKLDLPKTCFAFDLSLGCSGFVAALATVSGYLMATGGKRAVIFTADPYSKSMSEDDKNTSMIFGDAATATLIEEGATWRIGRFDAGTKASRALERDAEGVLRMNGRAVFDFCALNVPGSVKRTLELNDLTLEEVDAFALHPGSKYIVDTVVKRIGIPAPNELPCAGYGNTVSSSIPLILADMDPHASPTVLVSGFGVGLGWSTCVLTSEK